MKAHTGTLQSMAQRNQWSPSRSSLLTINMWRRLQAKRTVLWLLPLLSSYFLILFRQDAMYVTAIVHARGSSTSLWYNLSFCHATLSLSLNQSPTTRGLVSSTSGQSGYLTPAVSWIPTASERWAKSEVAHQWAKWLPHPCRIGDPHRFRAGGKIRSGPQVGKVATSPLPSRGSPPLQSGGQNQKWCPKEGRNCCVTPAVSAIPKKGGVDMAHVRPGQKGLSGLSLRAVLNNKKKTRTSLFYKKSVTRFFIRKKA